VRVFYLKNLFIGSILYTKDLNYTSSVLTSAVYTRISDSATETLTYIYTGGILTDTNYS